MDRFTALEQIANGIQAASRIKRIYESNLREDPESYVKPSPLYTISEALKIIAEYSPERERKILQDALHRSNTYYDTYRNIKHHMNSVNRQEISPVSLIQILNAMKPVLPNKHMIIIDKMTKIFEILSMQ